MRRGFGVPRWVVRPRRVFGPRWISRWAGAWACICTWSGRGERSQLGLQLLPDCDGGIVEGDGEASEDPRYHHMTFFERKHDEIVIGYRNEKTFADFASEGLFRFGMKDPWWIKPIPS